jgi:hypothetical protein
MVTSPWTVETSVGVEVLLPSKYDLRSAHQGALLQALQRSSAAPGQRRMSDGSDMGFCQTLRCTRPVVWNTIDHHLDYARFQVVRSDRWASCCFVNGIMFMHVQLMHYSAFAERIKLYEQRSNSPRLTSVFLNPNYPNRQQDAFRDCQYQQQMFN